jgi:hypothetical protein
MKNCIYLLPLDEIPSWLQYPHAFRRMVDQSLIHVTPWHLLEAKESLRRFRGLIERYPSRNLFPFAYRQDNDDLACWGKGMGEKVFIIHDFASQGWEGESSFENVWSWFRSAVEETIEWD